MKQRLGYIASFVAGIGLTIGVYETVRIVQNTRQALSAASSQLSEQAPVPASRRSVGAVERSRSGGSPGLARTSTKGTSVERQLEDLKDDPKLSPQQRADMAQKRATLQKGVARTNIPDRRARRQAARKQRMANMSPEERDAVRERRRLRRQRKQGGNSPPADAEPLAEEPELPVDELPDDEPFVDTGAP